MSDPGTRFLTAPHQVEAFWRFTQGWLGPSIRALWPVSVTGLAQIPTGPMIVVANHQSYLDPIVLGLAMPRAGAFLAMAPVFQWPLLGWLADLAGAMPVPAPRGRVLDQAERVLRAGHPVILYPEGMRTCRGGWGSVPLRQGAARLALETGAPIQPVALIGLERVLPKGAHWPQFGMPITVRFGPAFRATDVVGSAQAGDEEAIARVTAAIDRAVAELLPDHLKTPRREAAA
jgi:1-acyl-sn-glycerol-3-phosphate acyltransferase